MVRQKRTHRNFLSRLRRTGRGQGLVEFAFTLPLLLLVLAGVLEVANLLLLYSRMELAGREAARFGAMGGSNNGVRAVFLQNAEEGLERTPGVLEVWVIRPVLDYDPIQTKFFWEGDSSGITWGDSDTGECVYPDGSSCVNARTSVDPSKVLGKVTRYKDSGTIDAADGDRYVIVVVYYEAKTILNLPLFRAGGQTGRFPLRSSAIFRQEISQETVTRLAGGCSAYPIALSADGIANLGSAREGMRFGPIPRGAGGYDFLAWNPDTWVASSSLTTSLTKPGNSEHPVYGYHNPRDMDDTSMHRGDWVRGDPSSPSTSVMDGHIASERALRVILQDGYDGSNYLINDSGIGGGVYGFAIIRVIGYSSGQLSFEFVRFDNSCGEPEELGY